MDDNILIDAVRSRSEIYDKGHAGFKNPAIKESAWLSIAEIVNASAVDCISRWNTLRERYTKEKRLLELETRSGAGVSKRPVWVNWTTMNFLKSHVRLRKSIDNFTQVSNCSVVPPSLTSPNYSTSSSSEYDLEFTQQVDPVDESSTDGVNVAQNIRVLASCPLEMPSTSTSTTTSNCIGSTKSAAASLPYFGSAGRCKRNKPDEAMEMFKDTLSNLRENMMAPAPPMSNASTSDADELIGRSVTACLNNLSNQRKKLRYRKMFRELVQDCEEANLDDE